VAELSAVIAGCTVEGILVMETIRVVLDAELLKAADTAAKRRKVTRSQLVREALREHLARLRILEREEIDRRGYLADATGGCRIAVLARLCLSQTLT
jgi:metal-responsive CopG/Arc/MetJ family transcriptional regulator